MTATVVTGTAGFIGHAVALRLLREGREVVGVDVVSDYYDVRLKEARLERLRAHPGFVEARLDIADRAAMDAVFSEHRPRTVVHLAAQAGVRHSLRAPREYARTNLAGFLNVLEGCRDVGVEHLLYASTSSVYGANTAMPYREGVGADHPLSLYAATKRSNELMAHSYAHLFGVPSTGMRFFTVYGPWGRPDMAYWLFADAVLAGRPIDVFNGGRMSRDFTYVDDIVDAVLALVPLAPGIGEASGPAGSPVARARVLNIGHGEGVALLDFIGALETALGKKAVLNMMPMQDGDVAATLADTTRLRELTGVVPDTSVEDGVARFVEWFLEWRAR